MSLKLAVSVLLPVALAACVTPSGEAPSLDGTNWRFTSIDGAAPVAPETALQFGARLNANAGCNGMSGTWSEAAGHLRAGPEGQGGQLVAASLREARDYREAPYRAPCFIMVGNESQGLPEAYEAACDLRVTMPMRGRADSLNAAVAGAVLAYEVLARLGR